VLLPPEVVGEQPAVAGDVLRHGPRAVEVVDEEDDVSPPGAGAGRGVVRLGAGAADAVHGVQRHQHRMLAGRRGGEVLHRNLLAAGGEMSDLGL
jgi:hypothetical protein